MTEAQRKRVKRERERLRLRPWQLSPSEIDDGPNPYAATPNCAGNAAWKQAQAWRAEIRAREPGYFDGDDA